MYCQYSALGRGPALVFNPRTQSHCSRQSSDHSRPLALKYTIDHSSFFNFAHADWLSFSCLLLFWVMERGEGTVALRQRRGGARVETNDIPHSGWREPSAARGQQLSRSSGSQPARGRGRRLFDARGCRSPSQRRVGTTTLGDGWRHRTRPA